MEKKERKPKGYWQNYEHCKEEAQKYSGRMEFRLNSRWACDVASKHKWLDDFFPLNVKPLGYWNNYDHCYEEALKYFSRNSFRDGCSRAYTVASKNGWLDDYYWMRNRKHEGDDYWIYSYEDVENKAVYVGLTFRNRRHYEHKTDETDTVRLYFESINKPVPEPRIKMDNLNAEDAQYYEDWYKEKYAEAGWTVINKGKTGVGSSSLGNVRIKWDYEHCKEEASKYKYKTKYAFQKGCGGAYGAAKRNKWLDDFCFKEGRKPNGYWLNYDNCKEEANKYGTRTAFQKSSNVAYNAARKNGWLDDFFPKAA